MVPLMILSLLVGDPLVPDRAEAASLLQLLGDVTVKMEGS